MSSKEFLMCPRARDDYICLMEELGMPYDPSVFSWSNDNQNFKLEGIDKIQRPKKASINVETQLSGSNSNQMQKAADLDSNCLMKMIVATSSSATMEEVLNKEENSTSTPQQYSRIVRICGVENDESLGKNFLDRNLTAEEFERELYEDYQCQESSMEESDEDVVSM